MLVSEYFKNNIYFSFRAPFHFQKYIFLTNYKVTFFICIYYLIFTITL